jgi:hypothetical protein
MLGAVKRLAIDDFDVEIQALQPGMGGYRPLIATPSNWYDLLPTATGRRSASVLRMSRRRAGHPGVTHRH